MRRRESLGGGSSDGSTHFSVEPTRVDPLPVRPERFRNVRPAISTLLVVIDLITLCITLVNLHGPVRFVFGVATGLFVPGWSVVGLLKLKNAALEFSLTVGTSLSLLIVAAQILIMIHTWNLPALEVVTCLLCLPSLVRQSRVLRRWTSSR